MYKPTAQDHEREDEQMARSDRRLARLAAKVVGEYAGMDPHDAWLIFTRLRALRRRGISPEEIRARLDA